jgi:hypothetical protein
MKLASRNILFVLLGCTLTIVGIVLSYGNRGPSIRKSAISLVVEASQVDMGKIGQHEKIEAKFVIPNRNSEPIQLLGFQTSCSCLEQSCDRELLLPGEEAIITVVWKTGKSRGPIRNSMGVTWGVPGNPVSNNTIQLWAAADVIPDFIIEPEEVNFDADKASEVVIRCRDGRKSGFKITGAKSSNDGLLVQQKDAESLHIIYDPKKYRPDAAKSSDTISIYINHPGEPMFELPCYVSRN